MNVPLKAVVIGVALAALIVVSHLLFPVLLALLLLGLVRRVWFGSRWDSRYGGDGRGWGGMHRHGHDHGFGLRASGGRRIPSIDGSPWPRSDEFGARSRGAQMI